MFGGWKQSILFSSGNNTFVYLAILFKCEIERVLKLDREFTNQTLHESAN